MNLFHEHALAHTPNRLRPWMAVVVVSYAAALLVPMLGGNYRVLTLHEVFAAQPAREMLGDGQWIIPHFAGVPRLVKTPATGWLIALSMKLFGTEAEWAVRLPSALAGVATAWLVAALAARWVGAAAGLLAGFMQASFVYVIMQARLAEADIPMCAAVVLAMVAFARGAVDRPAGAAPLGWVLLFHLGAGLSLLFKGVGAAFVLAGCLSWIAVTGRWRALRFLLHPLGLVVFAGVALPWFVLAYRTYPPIADVWFRESVGRAGGGIQDDDPWHIYFWMVPAMLLPWLPFAVRGLIESLAARGARRRWLKSIAGWAEFARLFRRHHRAAFLLCWFAAGMLILLFSKARHKHYAIPMLPPITLLACVGFMAWLRESTRWSAWRLRRIAKWVAGFGAVAGVAALVFQFVPLPPHPVALMLLAVAGIALGISWTLHAKADRRRATVVTLVFGTTLAAVWLATGTIIPAYDDYRATADLGRRVSAAVPGDRTIYLVNLREHPIAFYLRRPIARADRIDRRPQSPDQPSDVERLVSANAGRPLEILCPSSSLPALQRFGVVVPLDRVDHKRRHEADTLVRALLIPIQAPTTVPANGSSEDQHTPSGGSK